MNDIIATVFITLIFMSLALAFDKTGFLRGRRLVNWDCVDDCEYFTTYPTSTCIGFCGNGVSCRCIPCFSAPCIFHKTVICFNFQDCVHNCWLDTLPEPNFSWAKCEQVCEVSQVMAFFSSLIALVF